MQNPTKATYSARAAASETLFRADPRKGPISTRLNQNLARTTEKQKYLDLVYGTLRHGRLIDLVIDHFGRCPVQRISRQFLAVLRPAVYELIFCPDTPVYAIVNEAVTEARHRGGRKQTGFVNAVLRSIAGHIKDRHTEWFNNDAQAAVRVDVKSVCVFDEPFLPNIKTECIEYLSRSFSLPPWLIKKWLTELGIEQANEVALACNRKPTIYLRVNPLKTQRENLLAELREHEVQCELLESHMIRLRGAGDITVLPGFRQGCFTVQDLCASEVVPLLAPQKNETILDLCAAPGTKTTQFAEVTEDQATIIATDIQAQRLANVRDNIHRLGLQSIRIVDYKDIDAYVRQWGPFDAILLDVPCSNTGVMARRPEIRYRLNQRDISSLVKTQSDLLEKAVGLIKPEGKLCYSTCSILREENQDHVKGFLSKYPDFALVKEKLTLPTARNPDHDGGYVAVLDRHSAQGAS